MNSNDMITSIIEKMEKKELKVLHTDMENKIVYSDEFLIQVHDMSRAFLYFAVSTKPEEAAVITLAFMEMKEFIGNGRLKIGESYYPINKNTILWGDDAYEEYGKDLKKVYLKETEYDSLMEDDDEDAWFTC